MRGQLPRTLALPVTAALLLLSAAPALAQEDGGSSPPTTPPFEPKDPGQAPISKPPEAAPLGRAVGDAGSALGVLRLLPGNSTTNTILPDDFDKSLPRQPLAEAGFGLTSAQANSESYLAYERSIASASPAGVALMGNAPQPPGAVTQTAMPDNTEPRTFGINPAPNPLLDIGLFNSSVQARWSKALGPCVGTIADASTEVASLSALNVVPSLDALGQVKNASEPLQQALASMPGQLGQLGGMLSGGSTPSEDGVGSVVSLPNTLSTRSVVRLVDIPGSANKAVESTSTMQVSKLQVLKGTPLGFTVNVVSQPTLRVTSTGNAETSTVEYTAPVLSFERGGEKIFELDAANPTKNIPIGIPLPGLSKVPGFEQVQDVPVIGGLAEMAGDGTKQISGNAEAEGMVVPLGVLKVSIAGLDKAKRDMTEPFKGYQLGASARMLDLQILPTDKLAGLLKGSLPPELADRMPTALAQVSLGEQIARAYAPTGGVVCGTTGPPAPPGGGEAPGVPENLAQTSAAYSAVPMFWTGTGLLLAGVVMVAAIPGRRRTAASAVKPSPRPRE